MLSFHPLESEACPSDFPVNCGAWCCISTSISDRTFLIDAGLCVENKISPVCVIESIYGENSEETKLLRHFRDTVLIQTPEGQAIIKLYYELNPILIKAVEENEEFKIQIKKIIDGVLAMIRENCNRSDLP